MYTTPIIYKLDVSGNIRQWQGFATENTWYSESGLVDGKKVTSTPRISISTNVGRSNERSAYEQAIFEVSAEMNKKLERGYFKNIEDIGKFEKFKPMLAQDYSKLKKPLTFPVLAQAKLDGIRCVFMGGKLWTRAGKEIVSCPHIEESLANFHKDNPEIVLDGELYNHDLKENFNEIVSVVRKTKPTDKDREKAKREIQYHVYDMYDVNDMDKDMSSRVEYLSKNVLSRYDHVAVVPTIIVNNQEELDDAQAAWTEDGYEGQMIRLNKPYQKKRSNHLLKRKEFITEEFQVVGVAEGKGNWSGAAKQMFLLDKKGNKFPASVRGTYEQLAGLLLENDPPHWATVRHFGFTDDEEMAYRFPVVIDYGYGERED